MTRAAEAAHVSQPSVSQAVRELETELGTHLFHRVGRRVVLTAAGEALVEPARQVLRDVDTGRAAVEAVAGLTAGRLDLVALPTLAADPVAPLVGAFRMQHPGIEIALADPADASELVELVASGACEVGITAETVHAAGLTSHALVHQDLLAVLPPGANASPTMTVSKLAQLPAGHRAGGHHHSSTARGRVRRSGRPAAHRRRGRAAGSDPPARPRRRRARRCTPVRSPSRRPRLGAKVVGAAPAAHPPGPPVPPRRTALAGRGPPSGSSPSADHTARSGIRPRLAAQPAG